MNKHPVSLALVVLAGALVLTDHSGGGWCVVAALLALVLEAATC